MILTVTLNPALDLNLETPELAVNRVARATASHMNTGGKGVNVSRVVHENGGATRALVLVAGDLGRVFERRVRRHGFPVRVVRGAGAETRINVVVTDAAHENYVKVNQAGPEMTDALWRRCMRAYAQALRGAAFVTLSGSLPPGAPPDGYGRMIRHARRAEVPVALDADGPALRAALESGPALVKPNRVELAQWAGRSLDRPGDIVQAAHAMLEAGPETVVVSDGPRSTYALTRQGAWRATPPPVEARGVVGTGDSLVAGLAWALGEGMALAEALRIGVAWGAATAQAPDTALCRRADAQALLPRVEVSPL